MLKLKKKLIAEFEKAGVNVSLRGNLINLTYYCEHGQVQSEDIPRDIDSIYDWLMEQYDSWDNSEKTIIWLDEFGHGKNGAPYDMEDVLSDSKEWENKLYELAEIAMEYE